MKNDGRKWSRMFYFEIIRAPSDLLLPSAKKSARKDGLASPVSRTLKGNIEYQNKKNLENFSPSFKSQKFQLQEFRF